MTNQQIFAFVNSCYPLQSLLYDMDLLPEQLKQRTESWRTMRNIVEHFKMAVDSARPEEGRGT